MKQPELRKYFMVFLSVSLFLAALLGNGQAQTTTPPYLLAVEVFEAIPKADGGWFTDDDRNPKYRAVWEEKLDEKGKAIREKVVQVNHTIGGTLKKFVDWCPVLINPRTGARTAVPDIDNLTPEEITNLRWVPCEDQVVYDYTSTFEDQKYIDAGFVAHTLRKIKLIFILAFSQPVTDIVQISFGSQEPYEPAPGTPNIPFSCGGKTSPGRILYRSSELGEQIGSYEVTDANVGGKVIPRGAVKVEIDLTEAEVLELKGCNTIRVIGAKSETFDIDANPATFATVASGYEAFNTLPQCTEASHCVCTEVDCVIKTENKPRWIQHSQPSATDHPEMNNLDALCPCFHTYGRHEDRNHHILIGNPIFTDTAYGDIFFK